ncbi:MAG: endopeptidase La [Eubacterium aggregans]|uniref:Lon protease n=2 Tax=Eubacterium aggregans TaxID=81409 RepID=A0A1H4A5A2_9FIRM|nr:endopeptidase La [Eubacterium aggregans]MEA5074295.1 endopeptidase La [Eubacterium aggregans]SEA30988.1 ATP-dependent proteinase. Serine peptidase. MEROPS family S16 [Eubacterium aggregans]
MKINNENTETLQPEMGQAFEELERLALEVVDGIPLIPMRGMSVFPGMVIHFDIGREKSINALEMAMTQNQMVLLVEQKDAQKEDPAPEDIFEVGCIAKVKQTLKMPDGLMRVLVEIKERAKITQYLCVDPYFAVLYEGVKSIFYDNKENRALMRMIRATFTQYMTMTRKVAGDMAATLDMVDDPDRLIDLICANLMLDLPEAQRILQETDINKRLMATYEVLVDEIEMARIEQDIDEKVKEEVDKSQREYVLREQIKVIQDELGDTDVIGKSEEYKERLEALDVSDEVREKVLGEIAHLSKVPSGSSESGVIESYIEWVLDLPWNTETEEEINVGKARRTLNKDHYALDKVKERILEYIAVLKLADNLKSPIICLVGPPGVGKTSIAKSIAKSLNRKYVRMSLGGMRDEAEIRGHRRTYVGAIPGRILYHLKQVKSRNPLFLLDEIDKMSQDFRGDPAAALLEVLDPEQNNTFTDNYLELPFDLSDVLFLTTANSLSTIPRPLLDRMEIIELNGYVESEKLEIAKRYLVPKQCEIHGLNHENFKINKKALQEIISYYTRESGVRELERTIARVCRGAAKAIVEDGVEVVSITPKNLENYLGMKKYTFDTVDGVQAVGLVNGLAWTAVGGETLEIEVAVLKGKGKVSITGQLGDVMQESAKAAISYIRSRCDALGIEDDFYETKDIHLHVPEGAVPKDGPSAGITMTTALISALTGKPVPRNLAMTGEITLRGRVLPIGGLREKLTAATRAGVKEIILPKANLKDLEEVPQVVTDALNIHPVSTMEEVTALVFGGQK